MIRENLGLLFRNYQIPEAMLQYGLYLLDQVLDLDRSNGRVLVLKQNGPWHYVNSSNSCENMVYFLVKHIGDSATEAGREVNIFAHTRLYAGQTTNFRSRESHRRGHQMRNSNIRICLFHDLNPYGMDCLESTSIAFSLLMFGMRTTNKTVYPRYIYLDIPENLNYENRDDHPTVQENGVNTLGMIRRVIVIGTALPQVVLDDPYYDANLRRWQEQVQTGTAISNPEMNWDDLDTSRSIRDLRDLVESEEGDLPTLLDHYPTITSGNYRQIFQQISMDEVIAADRDINRSIANLNRDVIIMYGARPTLLFPMPQARHFFAGVCSTVNLHWITREKCAFVFWWPHLGLRNHTNKGCQQMLEQIWILLAHKLHLLLWKLQQDFRDAVGVPDKQAIGIINWLECHATSQQLEDVLKHLTEIWTTVSSVNIDRLADYKQIIHFEVFENHNERQLSSLPQDSEVELLFPPRVRSELPAMTLAQVMNGWSANTQFSLVNMATKSIPGFFTFEEHEPAEKLQLVARKLMNQKRLAWMNIYISKGLFHRFPEETDREAWSRFWKMINMARMMRGKHPNAVTYTCCWCGQLGVKKPQEEKGIGRMNFGTRIDSCPNGIVQSLGWSTVEGDERDIYPQSNLFLQFFESLPESIVVNHWQLIVCFSYFLEENLWSSQARPLYDYYLKVFQTMRGFQSDRYAGEIAGFTNGLTHAMEKLHKIDAPVLLQLVPGHHLRKKLPGRWIQER